MTDPAGEVGRLPVPPPPGAAPPFAAAGAFPAFVGGAATTGSAGSPLAMASALVMSAAAWSSSLASMASGTGFSGVILRPEDQSMDEKVRQTT